MKYQKRTSVAGEYAKKREDINDQDVITVLDGGREVTGEYGAQQVFKMQTKNGEKLLTFNQTSLNNMIDAFGDDGDEWKGKQVRVHLMKQNVSGKFKDVVYLAEPSWVMGEDGLEPIEGKSVKQEVKAKIKSSAKKEDDGSIDPDNIPF